MKRLIAVPATALAALAIAAPITMAGTPAAAAAANKNLVETAVASGQFTTLVNLVTKAGLAGALTGSQRLTLFAPTDAAFAKMPKILLKFLIRHPAKLKSVLLYHVVQGEVPAAKVLKPKSAKTLEGSTVNISIKGASVYVNSAKVLMTDILTTNGVIHVINSVLLPPK
jgi:uncharacterized surface protein with fasciclin (FAS1) repeats